MTDKPETCRTKTGRVLTDADIQALADEAERGYDVEHLAKRPGRPRMGSAPAMVVPVRLHADLLEALKAAAAAESTSLSELARDALRAYLVGEPPTDADLRTASGRVLANAEIDALATDAEAGYDITALRGRASRRDRPWAEVVPVRMPPELKAEVERRAEAESTSVSEIIRAALRARLGGGDPPGGGTPRTAALPVSLAPPEEGSRGAVFPGRRGSLEGTPDRRQVMQLLPPDLPARPRVLQLTDVDCVSHGLADGTGRERASDQEVRSCLDRVQATAMLVDPQARIRCAISSESASRHLHLLTSERNNLFTIRRGLDGVTRALLEELDDLISARTIAVRPGQRRPAADLVILVAQDGIYAPLVRQLRSLGIPTWLLVPGRAAATPLLSACSAVTLIGPGRPPGFRIPAVRT